MSVTARGIGLLAAAVVLLAAGFGFGYAELSLLGAAGASAVGCALGYAAWRPRLAVTRRVDPDRVGRGEPAQVTLTVRNRGRLRAASLVAEDRCGAARVPVPVLRLRPGQDTTVGYPVPTDRRGVVPVGPLRVTGRDALRLVTVARAHGETGEVWVHPRIHHMSAVPAGIARSLDGRVDKVPQGSITFDSLREYVVGDELRRVHWRSSAKVGELMVREDLDTSLPSLVVLLDNRVRAHPRRVAGVAESFEVACEAAASVVAAARREGLPVTLLLVVDGASPAPDRSRRPAGGGRRPGGEDYLDRLAEVELRADAPGGGAVAASGGPATATDGAGTTNAGAASGGATSAGGASGGGALGTATTRLRQERLGDTLVYLTGPGGRDDLGYVGALRGAYPSVVVGVCDDAGGRSPVATGGMVVIDAADGAAFAAEWDGIQRW